MKLEIIYANPTGYTLQVEGNFFRYCKTYSELEKTISSLVKSKYLEDADGFI